MTGSRFGVIGNPIGHSLSPLMHEASFSALGLAHSYEKIDVAPNELADFIESAKRGGFSGLNVTIPHKQAVMPLLDEFSREAELIGAVNTIKFGVKNIGYNTDGIGFVRCLSDEGVSIEGKRILLVGAGGAGRAIAFQSTLEGGVVSIASEFKKDSVLLSHDISSKLGARVRVIECDQESIEHALSDVDVFVNATPVGMKPNVDASVIGVDSLPDGIVVVDIVYNPIETKLVGDALKRGLKTVSGVGMLVQQGAESERIWLDIEPPVAEMKKTVIKNLV